MSPYLLISGAAVLAYLVVVRAFSAKSRATMDNGEFGCFVVFYAAVVIGLALAADHLTITVR